MSYEPNPYSRSSEVACSEKPTTRLKPPTPSKRTMPVSVALVEFGSYQWKEGTSLAEVFLAGIAFAEEYHKIGPNENGDYL